MRSWESHLLPVQTAFKIPIIIDFLTPLAAALTAAMEAPFSTAPSNAPISQEVLRPEDYDLAAEISQFSEFRDDSDSDIDEEVL